MKNLSYLQHYKHFPSIRIWLLENVFTDQKRSCSKSPDIVSQGGYATSFAAGIGGGTHGIEGQIMASVFKALVTRLVKSSKELKAQENMVR
jgi:hypothetical protein